jgi:hypothetical protein
MNTLFYKTVITGKNAGELKKITKSKKETNRKEERK